MKAPFGTFTRPMRRRQQGQSMLEYAVICFVLAVALFAPMPGSQQTAAQLLCDSIRDFYSSLTVFISLP